MSTEIQVPESFQYMRPSQRQQMRDEIDSLRHQISNPTPGGADKGEMLKRVRRMEQTLDRQSPPALSPEQRDAYAREERRLREAFTADMLSGETMRKNPAGAVDRQLAFHNRHKRRIFRWKNIVRALDPENDSPDVSNIERFRPHRRPTDSSMHDAEIGGKTFVGIDKSPAYEEGWERTFGAKDEAPDADVEAMRAELAALREQLAKRKAKPKPKPRPGKIVEMACGKQLDARGKRWHVEKCEVCKTAEAPSPEPVPDPAA